MPSIPTIDAKHIQFALADIGRDGIPVGRGSTRFCLVAKGTHYPPKYVVALAAQHAAGRELRPDEFSGGVQTNTILQSAGFTVRACTCGGTRVQSGGSGARVVAAPAAQSRRRQEQPLVPASRPMPSRTSASGEVTVVRLVARGRTPDNPAAEERMLLAALGPHWPERAKAKFTITPGGFVHGRWPGVWSGRSGWKSTEADIEPLVEEAERQLARVVTDRVYRAAQGKTDLLTIGIDLNDDDDVGRAELVAVFDIRTRSIIRWTGKSYPTSGQERSLLHVVDLDTHLLEVGGERALILGCHDLNMFSPRGHANQSADGARRARCTEMKRKVARFKPTLVLQHPHSTDTPNIWRMPWLSLAREFPSVRAWASGIAYYSWTGKVRAKLDRVLDQTKSADADVRDIVLDARAYG